MFFRPKKYTYTDLKGTLRFGLPFSAAVGAFVLWLVLNGYDELDSETRMIENIGMNAILFAVILIGCIAPYVLYSELYTTTVEEFPYYLGFKDQFGYYYTKPTDGIIADYRFCFPLRTASSPDHCHCFSLASPNNPVIIVTWFITSAAMLTPIVVSVNSFKDGYAIPAVVGTTLIYLVSTFVGWRFLHFATKQYLKEQEVQFAQFLAANSVQHDPARFAEALATDYSHYFESFHPLGDVTKEHEYFKSHMFIWAPTALSFVLFSFFLFSEIPQKPLGGYLTNNQLLNSACSSSVRLIWPMTFWLSMLYFAPNAILSRVRFRFFFILSCLLFLFPNRLAFQNEMAFIATAFFTLPLCLLCIIPARFILRFTPPEPSTTFPTNSPSPSSTPSTTDNITNDSLQERTDTFTTLTRLLQTEGIDLAFQFQRLEAFFADLCPEGSRELHVLLCAAQINIPRRLADQMNTLPDTSLLPPLSLELQQRYAIDQFHADWALQTWYTILRTQKANQ